MANTNESEGDAILIGDTHRRSSREDEEMPAGLIDPELAYIIDDDESDNEGQSTRSLVPREGRSDRHLRPAYLQAARG